MNNFRNIFLILPVCIIAVTVSCSKYDPAGKVLITSIPSGVQYSAQDNDASHFPEGSVIMLADPQKPSSIEVLTGGFHSAFGPEVSWDGTKMLFTARKNQDDPWQIWEMDLKSHKVHRISETGQNCIDPVYLPIDKVIYSQQVNDKVQHYALFNSNIDGSDAKQVTYHPHSNFGTIVMHDGRLLTFSKQAFPGESDPMLMVMRPDGTKAEYFYQGGTGNHFASRAKEKDGIIYVIQINATGRGDIISILYNRPASSSQNLTQGIDGSFNAIVPMGENKLLVSYRRSDREPFGLYEFNTLTKELGKEILMLKDASVYDAVAIDVHERPKKLPSEVDMGVKTGLLLCQNVNFTGMGITAVPESQKAYKIEIVGIDSSLGIIDIEQDGSFYLKIQADQPFRIRTLDKSDKVINQGSAWIWLRPNERRGCIGCHEDRELAPDNMVPLAVKKSPVSVPVMISNIHEKEVELE